MRAAATKRVVLKGAVALFLALLLASCGAGGEGQGSEKPGPRVVFLGLDGVDWRVADPLMEAGRMPHLESLVGRGVRAPLRTIPPPLSPVLWTTIATGQRPERHGIIDFIAEPAGGGPPVPVTSTLRRVPALWNLLSQAGLSVGVVAWWATYPAEEVEGYLVSDRLAYQLFGLGSRPAGAEPRVWPPELEEELLSLVVSPEEVPFEEMAELYLPRLGAPEDLPEEQAHLVEEFRRYLASTRTYLAASRKLSPLFRPDFDALYLELPDTASHLFMPYRPPRLPTVSEEEVRRFGEVVDRVYERMDRVLGELIERNGPEALYLVCSDHGFRSGDDRLQSLGSRIGSGGAARWHRRDGILVLAGPGIRRGHRIRSATILDLAPTVLALLGLPVPEDMEGRVLTEAFTEELLTARPVRNGPPSGERKSGGALASREDAEILEKLTALGYLAEGARSTNALSQAGKNAANNRGMLALSRGDLEEAIAAFEEALQEAPDFDGARANLGRALMQAGRNEEARAVLERVLESSPDSFEVEYLLGSIALEEGDLETAEERFLRSTGIEPNFADAHNSLGLLEAERGNWGRALAHYREAIRANPDLAEPYLNTGNVHWSRGDGAEAERWYRRAIEADAFYGGGHAALALVLQTRGDLDAAEQEYEEALQLGAPDEERVWNNYGNLALRREQPELAIERYRKAIELDAGYAEPHNGLGAAYMALDRGEEAVGAYREALRIDPGYSDPLRNLALLLLSRGGEAEARPLLERALALRPEDAELARALGRIRLEDGRLEEAEVLTRRALELRPREVASLNQLGEILALRGDRGGAVLALRRSLDLKPAQPEVQERLDRLVAGGS